MKTKAFKTISLCIAAVCISLACATFISCGDDGGSNNNGGGGSNSGVVGKWVGQNGSHLYTVTVASNGTGVMLDQYNDSYSGTNTESCPFTYTMTSSNEGVINMQEYDSYSGRATETMYFTVDGNTMYIYKNSSKTYIFLTLTKGVPPVDNISGTWRGVNGREEISATFNNNGTGTYVHVYNDPYSGRETSSGSFTYTLTSQTKGTAVFIWGSDSYASYSGSGRNNYILSFEIVNNKMYTLEGYESTVYHGENYDYEWILTK